MTSNYFLSQTKSKIIFITIIIPIILQLFTINLVELFVDSIIYYCLFIFFYTLYFPYFYWFYNCTKSLYKLSNKNFEFNFNHYKITLIIIMIAILNFVIMIAYMFRFVFKGGKPDPDIFIYIFIIQFSTIIASVYNSYLFSKLLCSLELKREAKFSDYASYFVILAFPPLAVYTFHDKIKRILENRL